MPTYGEKMTKTFPIGSTVRLAGNVFREYVKLRDGWVMSSYEHRTPIRGILENSKPGARIFQTSELPADTKAV
jgi:hypothetical protein